MTHLGLKISRATILLALSASVCECAKPTTRDALESPTSVRLVVSPSSIAALSASELTNGLPAEVRFGGPAGRSALYLKFPAEWRAHGAPERAFIALSARASAPSDASPVTLEVWRANAEWQPNALQKWSDKPELAPPYARLEVTDSAGNGVRIDVTELFRFAAQHPERDFGVALLASGGHGHGTSVATGMSGGQAPRLELYYRH